MVAASAIHADTANPRLGTVRLLLGGGCCGFGARTDFATGAYPRSVTVADCGGDDRPDLAASGLSDCVSILGNTASPRITITAPTAVGSWPTGSNQSITRTLIAAVCAGELRVRLKGPGGSWGTSIRLLPVAGQTRQSVPSA